MTNIIASTVRDKLEMQFRKFKRESSMLRIQFAAYKREFATKD